MLLLREQSALDFVPIRLAISEWPVTETERAGSLDDRPWPVHAPDYAQLHAPAAFCAFAVR